MWLRRLRQALAKSSLAGLQVLNQGLLTSPRTYDGVIDVAQLHHVQMPGSLSQVVNRVTYAAVINLNTLF